MEIFLRLIPYVRPHLRKMVVSWLLAVVIAVMWGANFMAAWPLVKTLFENKTIQQEVAEMIVEAETTVAAHEDRIKALDAEISSIEAEQGSGEVSGGLVRRVAERGRQARKLTDAQAQAARLKWVEYRILGWVPEDAFKTFMVIICGLVLGTVIKCVCLFFQEAIVGDIVERVLQGIRTDCLNHALSLDYATTSRQGAAGLMSRFTFDAQRLSECLTLLSGRLIREPLKALACMCVAFYVNWRLTLLCIVVVPALGVCVHYVGTSLKRASRKMMESMSRLYEQLEETLNGLKAVIAFNRTDDHARKFAKEYDEYLNKAVKVVRYNAITRPTTEMFSTVAVILAITPCAYLVISGETSIWGMRLTAEKMDPAKVAMIYGALAGLLDPCNKLTKAYSMLRGCTAAVERIFGFLDTRPAVTKPDIVQSTPSLDESIEFRAIKFQYPRPLDAVEGINPLVLDGVDLKIFVGECVAIVGENGCGKSTLLSFLPRFYEPSEGQILVDGVPLTGVDPADFREHIAVVAQDTVLFKGSILENIRYGRESASDAEVMAAAEAASVTQFVDNLPNGFSTNVGIQGKSLSGGQRQRISLARAMIREPKLLLLDEPTSAIDAQSEEAIHRALRSFTKGRTTLMVTHSITPQILDFVTRIVVVSNGQIEADGTHEKLLATSPSYQRLFSNRSSVAA